MLKAPSEQRNSFKIQDLSVVKLVFSHRQAQELAQRRGVLLTNWVIFWGVLSAVHFPDGARVTSASRRLAGAVGEIFGLAARSSETVHAAVGESSQTDADVDRLRFLSFGGLASSLA